MFVELPLRSHWDAVKVSSYLSPVGIKYSIMAMKGGEHVTRDTYEDGGDKWGGCGGGRSKSLGNIEGVTRLKAISRSVSDNLAERLIFFHPISS